MKESAVERHLKKQCDLRNAWCVKLVLFGQAGFPDRTILAPGGRVAFLELKRPGQKPKPLQEWVLAKLRGLGFRADWTDTKEGVDAFLEEWLDAA